MNQKDRTSSTSPRPELLAMAMEAGACLTGTPDGLKPIEVVFSVEAWRAFDAALLKKQHTEHAENDCWRALCAYLLVVEEPIAFLRAWNEGSFEVCRREWPGAPEAVFPEGSRK